MGCFVSKEAPEKSSGGAKSEKNVSKSKNKPTQGVTREEKSKAVDIEVADNDENDDANLLASSSHRAKPKRDGVLEGAMFGAVHVGREGEVDLRGRNLDALGSSLVKTINEDNLGREAKILTLTGNRLHTLGKELILIRNLEGIHMNQNRFTHLPDTLTQLKYLKKIDVSGNPMKAVGGFENLNRLSGLTCLIIRDCKLTEVPEPILNMGPQLMDLDLSNNPDIKLSKANFGKLKLKIFKIANCGLTGRNLPGGVKVVRTIVVLDISGNKFEFDDDDDNFFGKYMPDTLKSLEIRNMELTSVPQVVARLKKLRTLDLSENPIETLDVLAGRLIKRISKVSSGGNLDNTAASTVSDTTTNTNARNKGSIPTKKEKEEDAPSETDRASTSSRISMSKVSKAGMISSVAQPIPLKKLIMCACDFRTMPKYFHKMTNLEELDISENYYLDDPNMTLFSLQKLKSLNITGCPFADEPSKARNEWFDIAKLSLLRNLQWEQWKVSHNMSPYRTKIPIEICGMKLQTINEVALRDNLFTGNTVTTTTNLLRDGYFKVDLAVDEGTVFSHFEAIRFFLTGKDFFFHRTRR